MTDATSEPQTPLSADAATEAAQAEAAMAAAGAVTSQDDEIAQLKATLQDMADQVLRAKAAAENARRRADEDIAKSRKFAVESFAESLLPILDSMDAALAVESVTVDQMREGVQATQAQLVSALERNRVVAIAPAAGAKFDPNQHQAIAAVPSDQEPNTVVAVLQKGYLIAERVLRPALVSVASAA